jgi:spermidine/putrescine-binding protein
MVLELSRKGCALGNMHSPDVLPALRQKPELGARVPAKDPAFVLLMWVVPSDTPRAELAHAAIDHILSTGFQTEFARRGSATSIPAVAAATAKADPAWAGIYPADEAALAAVRYYPYDAYFRDWDAVVEAWDREVLRKG